MSNSFEDFFEREMKAMRAAHRRVEPADGDDDDDGEEEFAPAGYGEGDFIRLDGGRTFVRKFEVVALRWDQYVSEPEGLLWRLNVYFSDCPHSVLYGEEARDVLRSFGLPEDPPK